MATLIRRYICWLLNHSWALTADSTTMFCSRCRRTHQEIQQRTPRW